MSNALSVFVCETRSGRVLERDIPISGVPSAGKRINTEGPMSFGIPMSQWFDKSSVSSFLNPWYYSFGVEFGSEILQCGPLVAHPEYDADNEEWMFDCAGIWRLFNTKRILVFSRDYPDLSRHDIVVNLLTDDMAQLNGDLPIDLPDADGIAGPGAFFDWRKWSKIGELLKDQTDDEFGVELEFKPYYTDTTNKDFVRWDCRIGAPYLGNQDSAHSWHTNQSLIKATPVGGGERIADLYIVPGQTSGDLSMYGAVNAANGPDALQDQGWPLLMDLDGSHTSSNSQTELDGYAGGNYSAFHEPSIRTIKARVRTNPAEGTGPRLSEWTLGDLGNFAITGYIGLPDGTYSCRVIGADLATLEEVDLDLQLLSEVPA